MKAFALTHSFWFESTPAQGLWAYSLFKDVRSLSKLEVNIENLAFPENETDLNGKDPFADVLGDGWEAFTEIFMEVFGLNPHINFTNLAVCQKGQRGVDFTGTDVKGRNSTIQSKYKGRAKAWNIELAQGPAMQLERMLIASQNEFNVDVKHQKNIIVFTNAKGVHEWTLDNTLYNKVVSIGRPQIRSLVDHNPAFWDLSRKCIEATVPGLTF